MRSIHKLFIATMAAITMVAGTVAYSRDSHAAIKVPAPEKTAPGNFHTAAQNAYEDRISRMLDQAKGPIATPAPETQKKNLVKHVKKPTTPKPAATVTPAKSEQRQFTINAGDKLWTLLNKNGVGNQDRLQAVELIKQLLKDSRPIQSGTEVRLVFDEHMKLLSLAFSCDATNEVHIARSADNKFIGEKKSIVVGTERQTFKGKIEGTLSETLHNQGLPASVSQSMVSLFEKKADLSHLPPGSSFQILYERNKLANGKTDRGRIVRAVLTTGGRNLSANLIELGGGLVPDYFDDAGVGLRSAMDNPVPGGVLGDTFGPRIDPITGGVQSCHKGHDYLAKIGTPIQNVMDGVVVAMEWVTGYGHTIKIRHGKDLETFHAHTQKYRVGLKVGMPVKAGDVIAYVGTSGERVTGPNDHFEVRLKGEAVNPAPYLTVPVIPAKYMAEIRDKINGLKDEIAGLDHKKAVEERLAAAKNVQKLNKLATDCREALERNTAMKDLMLRNTLEDLAGFKPVNVIGYAKKNDRATALLNQGAPALPPPLAEVVEDAGAKAVRGRVRTLAATVPPTPEPVSTKIDAPPSRASIAKASLAESNAPQTKLAQGTPAVSPMTPVAKAKGRTQQLAAAMMRSLGLP